MRRLLCLLIFVSTFTTMAFADTYTLYFTRHMEKTDKKTDPELSIAGQQRAHMLAQILKLSLIHI